MNQITVVDARMGRGKSSAMINHMTANSGRRRFLYITPYLTEVSRVCEACDFEQADGDTMSKLSELKMKMRSGKNVAATHALFYLLDDECLEVARDGKYDLVIDESIEIVSKVAVSAHDFDIITTQMTTEDDDGRLRWVDKSYIGKFTGYKELADAGSLHRLDSALISTLNPELITAFDNVFMLTYLFDGSLQKAYLDYFGFSYTVCGIRDAGGWFELADGPDSPPPIDYKSLIRIVDNKGMNDAGERRTALSKNWYAHRGRDNAQVTKLRKSMDNFFNNMTAGSKDTRLWTCFKDDAEKLVPNNGRYRRNFLQLSARATNEYRHCTDIAYMINRFVDPNLLKLFYEKGIVVEQDVFALSEMLQWIWRSAIRDGKPINLYIPSKRMRDLLTDWMDRVQKGGECA